MAFTVQQIVNQMLTQLRALDPAISAEVGTPERKIFEAGAEVAAAIEADLEVLNVQHDIDTMVGARLDSFLALFGMGRQRSVQATGTVTFSKLTVAAADIVIPKGTQVLAKQSDASSPTLVFATSETVVLRTGQTEVVASIICSLPGTIGNVPANSINTIVGIQALNGISRVDNASPTIGGLDGEDDATFKIRFKNTIFRNISGTNDQYLALAVASPFVTKANIVGPMSRWQERIQVPQGSGEDPNAPNATYDDAVQTTPYDVAGTVFPHKRTTAKVTIPYSKYTYSYNHFLTNGEFGTATKFYRPNVDYVFNNEDVNSTQPTFTIINLFNATTNPDGPLKPGDIILSEHAYLSSASRNKIATPPAKDILNCVDVYIDGSFPSAVASVEVMPSSNNDFTNTSTNPTYVGNFERLVDGSTPISANRYQPLFWQPLIDVPDTITIDDNKYYKAKYKGSDGEYYADVNELRAAHYFVVHDVTENRGTVRARNGIEWRATLSNGTTPADGELLDSSGVAEPAKLKEGTSFTIEDYYFDQNIMNLQAISEKHKQTATDILIHQAKYRSFKLYITVMYSRAATPTSVDNAIVDAVNRFYKDQYFGSVIQMSDILQVIHNVPGVDNVRWTSDTKPAALAYSHSGGATQYMKVEEVRANGQRIANVNYALVAGGAQLTPYDTDFILRDDELASLPTTDQSITAALVIERRAQNTFNA